MGERAASAKAAKWSVEKCMVGLLKERLYEDMREDGLNGRVAVKI